MLKPLTITLMMCASAHCQQKPYKIGQYEIDIQAADYAQKYTSDLVNGFSVVRTKNKFAIESFSFNLTAGLIHHQKFKTPLREQFSELLTKHPDLYYELSKREIKDNLTNYYFEDCSFLEDAVEYALNKDMSTIEEVYTPPLEDNRVFFKYSKDEYRRSWVTVESNDFGHPLFDVYQRLKNDIKKCEHPKIPKKPITQ